MISAKGLLFNSSGTWDLLRTIPEDRPLIVQLFGSEASALADAVLVLRDAGHRWFDLNMGCPIAKVQRQGAGAALLRDLGHALDVAGAMIAAAGKGHVGFKLRLVGDDPNAQHCLDDLCRGLVDAGAGWLTLHPRTMRQGFGGSARWEHIGRLASAVGVPVLASGDLFTALDGMRCLAETGAAGLMYARGALRDPAIFRIHHALKQGLPPPERTWESLASMIRRHMSLAQELGSGRGALLKMRSVIPRYLHGIPGAKRLREDICRCESWQGLESLMAALPLPDEVLPILPQQRPGSGKDVPPAATAAT